MSEIVMFGGFYLWEGMLVLLAMFVWGFACSLIPKRILGLLLTLGSFTLRFILYPHAILSLQAIIEFFSWNVIGLTGYGIGFLIFRTRRVEKTKDVKP